MAKTPGDIFWDEIEKHSKKNQIDDPFGIGKVVSENPLIIEIEGLYLYKDNLYINPHLLAWDEEVHAKTTTVDLHSHEVFLIHHYSKLKLGTHVACYGIDYNEVGKTYQKYVVMEVVE